MKRVAGDVPVFVLRRADGVGPDGISVLSDRCPHLSGPLHEGDIVTCAGVSAGIDLGLWLAGQVGGEGRAKVIQLSMEYDPQPPFDSGHMSKASATTKAAATALMSKDLVKPKQLKAATGLLWDHAIDRARAKRRRGKTTISAR